MMANVVNAHTKPYRENTRSKLTKCPACNEDVGERKLNRHLRKVHGRVLQPAGMSSVVKPLSGNDSRLTAHLDQRASPKKTVRNNKAKTIGWKPGDLGLDKEEKVKVNKKFYRCWQCGKLLTKASTANHLLKKHGVRPKDPDTAHFWYFDEVIKVQYRDKPAVSPSAKKPRKKPEVDWRKEVERLSMFNQQNRKTKTVTCPVCSASLKATNVKKHFNKVHKELLREPQVAKQAITSEDRKVSPKKRSLDVRPDYEYSEYVFDRAKVYQGGAYGLGASRKH